MNEYNYFEEVNLRFRNENFNFEKRQDPDLKSKRLITDLVDKYIDGKKTPSGHTLKKVSIEQTRDENKRWYAKIWSYKDERYVATFGLTADYIGASINWALNSGVSNQVLVQHLSISRTLAGHLLLPTWYTSWNIQSWNVYPEGISINMAKGGEKGYYDRVDYALLAIKNWYLPTPDKKNKLYNVIEKNKIWFDLFCDFNNYIKFFGLESLINKDGEVFDLTSYNRENETYDNVLHNDSDASLIKLPQDTKSYERYIDGCSCFICLR